MGKIHTDYTSLIGNTPMVELVKTEREYGLKAQLVAKIEAFNPGGSSKDRVALAMINAAERDGKLLPGGTIIEPTSGNTGVGLAWIAAVKGYRAIFTMPETMSMERRKLLTAYGAEVVLTPGCEGMQGAIDKANELLSTIPNAIIPQQFCNPANPQCHIDATAEEIWRDTDGLVDIFVAGVGTGGTVSGTAEGLKRHNPKVKAVAVEPLSSPMLTEGRAGSHKIQGIGANFVPANYHAEYVDEVMPVADDDALNAARNIAKREGILVGISSGAALHAAIELAKREENAGKMIVVFLPDTGERYLSTQLFFLFDVED